MKFTLKEFDHGWRTAERDGRVVRIFMANIVTA